MQRSVGRSALLGVVVGLGTHAVLGQPAQQPPLPKPTVPQGFTVTVFAEGLATPRHIAVRDNGDVYVTLRSGQAKFRPTDEPGGIAALRDTDADGVADVQTRFGTPDIDTGLALTGIRRRADLRDQVARVVECDRLAAMPAAGLG